LLDYSKWHSSMCLGVLSTSAAMPKTHSVVDNNNKAFIPD